jgi:hypothetical protein
MEEEQWQATQTNQPIRLTSQITPFRQIKTNDSECVNGVDD